MYRHERACENSVPISEEPHLTLLRYSARSAGCMQYGHMMKQSLDRGVVRDLTVDGHAASDEFQDAIPEHVHHLIATSQLDSQNRT